MAASAGPARAGGAHVRTRALGIDLELDFACPGLPSERAPAGARTVVSLACDGARWSPAGRTERCVEQRFADGRAAFTIDVDERGDYRVWAERFGTFVVAGDGSSVACIPGDGVARGWWQRLLLCQVLPLAAILRGIELLHASAVALDGRALAITARSGTGKTTVAAECVAAGASFLTDDVLAIAPKGDALLAHPGPGVAFIAEEDLGPLVEGPFGNVVDRSDKAHVAVERCSRALPLEAMYFLTRDESDSATIEQLTAPGASLIMAASFNFYLRTPDRLTRQLDLAAKIARSVRVIQVAVPRAASAAETAARIRSHFSSLVKEAA